SSGEAGGTPRWLRYRSSWWSASVVQSPRDVDHLVRGQPERVEVIVVLPVELREVGALRPLLAHALHLLEDGADQLRLRRDARIPQRVLDHQCARMLAVDVLDLRAHVVWRDELVDRGVDEHARRMDARLMGEDVEADSGLGGLDRNAADPLEMARQVAQLLVLEARDLDAEQVAKLQ